MKVKELKNTLNQFDDDSEVYVTAYVVLKGPVDCVIESSEDIYSNKDGDTIIEVSEPY